MPYIPGEAGSHGMLKRGRVPQVRVASSVSPDGTLWAPSSPVWLAAAQSCPFGAGCHKYNLLECLLAALNQLSQLETLSNMGERFGRPIERLSEMTGAFGDFLLFDTPEYSKLRDPSNFVDLFAQAAGALSQNSRNNDYYHDNASNGYFIIIRDNGYLMVVFTCHF